MSTISKREGSLVAVGGPLPSRGLHVCIFTSAHPVDDVRVNSKIASSFLESGHSVSWIGPASSFFTASVTPDPRIQYILTRPNNGRRDRLLSASRIAAASKRLRPVDWWYAPDPDAAALAIRLARRCGGKVIFDLHEVYHKSLMDRWLYGRKAIAIRELVRRRIANTCARADLVIGVNGSVLEPYVLASNKAFVVRNSAPRWFANHTAERQPSRGTMRVMHGKVLPSNGTTIVLDALEEVLAVTPDVEVIMTSTTMGQDTPYVTSVRRRLAQSDFGDKVVISGGLPHHEMPSFLRTGDVGMIAYGQGLGRDSLPNRFFEYMAAGLAILAPRYSKEIMMIMEAEDIGVSADFEDPHDVSRALLWLFSHPKERAAMGNRASDAFRRRHNWDHEFCKLLAAMESRS